MRNLLKDVRACISTFLLVVLVAGCGDLDKAPSAANLGSPLNPPTVTSVTPPNGSTAVCPNTAIVSATFSKAMNPATLTTSTFTVTAGGANVPGAVSYVAATQVATFTPTAPLTGTTTFTATITTGAADTFGNTLATNFVWTFTTSAPCPGPPPPPPGVSPLLTACNFGILGATPVVSNVGPTIVSGGAVGIWPAMSITGFSGIAPGGPGTTVPPLNYHAGDPVAMQAQSDLTAAYNTFAGTAGGAAIPADIGGLTLAPGVYKNATAVGITGNLTLAGPASGIWIFQIGSTLTTAAGNSQIIMSGGGLPKNVFWQVGSSATLGTNTNFSGNILALASITATTGATINGRALARNGAVTLDSNPVNVPSCP